MVRSGAPQRRGGGSAALRRGVGPQPGARCGGGGGGDSQVVLRSREGVPWHPLAQQCTALPLRQWYAWPWLPHSTGRPLDVLLPSVLGGSLHVPLLRCAPVPVECTVHADVASVAGCPGLNGNLGCRRSVGCRWGSVGDLHSGRAHSGYKGGGAGPLRTEGC